MSSSKRISLSLQLQNGFGYVSLLFLAFFLLNLSSCRSTSESKDRGFKQDSRTNGNDARREKIVEFARSYQGTAYKYAGKDPKGFDCSGFTFFVMKSHQIQIGGSAQLQYENGKTRPLKELRPGDLVFFGRSLKKITHVGIITKNSSEGIFMIHSSSSRGIIEENIDKSPYWQERILIGRTLLN